jgi:polyhydroxyalkanoate synthesis regulator phasin
MNSDHLLQLLHKGFRATLGATTSLIETLQDPQKREQNLSQFRSEFGERFQEWAEKGEITEQEARNLLDSLLRQRNNQSSSPSSAAPTPSESTTPSSTPTAPPDVQLEMQELTAQIAAIRAELEKLRDRDSGV